jgi:chromosome segregation ATPase
MNIDPTDQHFVRDLADHPMTNDIASRLTSVERSVYGLRSEYRSVSDRLKIIERVVRELVDEPGGGDRDELHDEFRIALDTANAHVDTLVTEKARLKEQLDLASASRAEALAVVADQRNQIGALRAEIEAIIAGFDMLAEKIGDQFLFEQSEPIQMVREEIYNVLRESPRWREAAGQRAARAVLHARMPDPNEEDV